MESEDHSSCQSPGNGVAIYKTVCWEVSLNEEEGVNVNRGQNFTLEEINFPQNAYMVNAMLVPMQSL